MTDGERRTEFDPRYKAGTWAARIETQDKVAAIVSVECLANVLELVPRGLVERGGRIAFEAREDFEICWDGGRQYVSVKDRQVDRSDLIDGLRDLQVFSEEHGSAASQTLRIEAASLTSKARSFYEDVQRLRAVKNSGVRSDYESVTRDFQVQHAVSARLAEHLILSERRIGGQSGPAAAAMFAHAIRNAVRVHNYSDSALITLFEDLANGLMRERRRARGVLALEDLERFIVAPLVPVSIAQFRLEYVRTRFGYVRDKERAAERQAEERLVWNFGRSLMREWRRRTYWDRFRDSLYRGHIGCLECGHPMIANYNGRRGLACPDCGYQPFISAFYACDCGSGILVQSQPNLTGFEFVRDAIRILHERDLRCMGCGRPPSEEKFIGRLFTLPIPYPIEGYPARTLIAWREALGWVSRRRFSGSASSPREALELARDESPEPFPSEDQPSIRTESTD